MPRKSIKGVGFHLNTELQRGGEWGYYLSSTL